MTSIFISYRRQDSAGHSGRLYDRLAAVYGADAVFMDYYDLAPGQDFPRAIDDDVARADAVLAVIGPQWIHSRDAAGTQRLAAPGDFVAHELESAFATGKRVIPVLVGGATMPASAELPQSLAALAQLQACELRDARFDDDMKALLRSLPDPAPAPQSDASAALVGDWVAEVAYWGDTITEHFHFELDAGELFGYATYCEVKRPLDETELLPDGARFVLHTEQLLGSDERRRVRHVYRVRIEADGLAIRLQSTGGFHDEPPLKFTARRAQGA